MCRFLAIVAARAVELRACLQAGPRSLAELSREHPDGWGVALFEPRGRVWEIHRGVDRALDCARFRALAAATRAFPSEGGTVDPRPGGPPPRARQ